MKNNTERRFLGFGLWALGFALCAGAGLTACATPRAAGALTDAAPPIAVRAVPVAMADVDTAIESGGLVQAHVTAAITARLVAPVREVRVLPGDRVRRGQTLIVLDGDDLAAAARAARSAAAAAAQGANAAAAELRAVEAALTLARASQERIAVLHARHSATDQEFDDATAMLRGAEARAAGASARVLQTAAAVDSARAAGDQAAATASFTRITAPFDGVVTDKMVEPGNMASPGMPLLRLEDTRRFHLEVRVDESRAATIRMGDSVPVQLGAGRSALNGTVTEISRAVDADARAFRVKIALPDLPGLRSGEFGKARFAGTQRRALSVPASAIARRGQLTSVFVIDGGRARLRLINVRDSEVVAGLAESELVIVSPPAGLTDGRRVSAGGK